MCVLSASCKIFRKKASFFKLFMHSAQEQKIIPRRIKPLLRNRNKLTQQLGFCKPNMMWWYKWMLALTLHLFMILTNYRVFCLKNYKSKWCFFDCLLGKPKCVWEMVVYLENRKCNQIFGKIHRFWLILLIHPSGKYYFNPSILSSNIVSKIFSMAR